MAGKCRSLTLYAALLALTTCGVGGVPSDAQNPAVRAQGALHRQPVHPAVRPSPASGSTKTDTQSMLDENDRVIAQNQRMIDILQSYSRIDAGKLDRLKSRCQQRLGGELTGTGAKSVVECIQSSW